MYTVTTNGVLKAVESWSVTIPLRDNQGSSFKKEFIDSLLEKILLDYPGFTIISSLGYWKGNDQIYVDQNYQIVIDTVPDNSGDSSEFFSTVKAELQKSLQQEKIYITKQDS